MKRISGDELKKVQLDILDVTADFCKKNGIHYWIDCGTLLGAIRHKGYIPWDDDIDVGMLRPDYDKFMVMFNEKNRNTRYRFCCPEIDPEFCYAHGKVIDTETVLYEPDEKGRKTSINIDIFVYDNAPDDDRAVKKMYDRRDWLRKCNAAHSQKHDALGGFLRNTVFAVLRLLTSPFPKNYFALKMVENSKKYNDVETKRVGDFTPYVRMVAEKDIFDDFVDVEFEGKLYNAPVGYDRYLEAFYGDYMQLPPPEERVSHHKFIAYINT